MKIFITVIMLPILFFACKNNYPPAQKIAHSKGADSILLKTPSGSNEYWTGFMLDSVKTGFTGDTTRLISQALQYISQTDALPAHDTFAIFEKTTEGMEVMLTRDTSFTAVRFTGTLYGEMGKRDFSYYLLPQSIGSDGEGKLSAVVFKDVTYDRPMNRPGMKIKQQYTSFEIFGGNKLVAVLDTKKKRIQMSEDDVRETEAHARSFFKDYIGQISHSRQTHQLN